MPDKTTKRRSIPTYSTLNAIKNADTMRLRRTCVFCITLYNDAIAYIPTQKFRIEICT